MAAEARAYGAKLPALRPGGTRIIDETLSFLAAGASTRLLDIGCGRGESLALARSRFGCVCAGAEPGADYAALAAAACPGADIRCAAAHCLPFADGSFDIALLECVFSLLGDTQAAALAELRRVLAAAGKLVLADVYARAGAGLRFPAAQPLLRALWTAEGMEQALNAAGFCLLRFVDYSRELAAMFGQMIFDGTACACFDQAELALLRRARAGYGVWVWEKMTE